MAWELKDFWKKQIKKLLSFKGVESYLLFTDKTWEQQLYDGDTWQELNDIALEICQRLYDRATVEITPAPTNLENLLADLPLLEHILLEESDDTESDDSSEGGSKKNSSTRICGSQGKSIFRLWRRFKKAKRENSKTRECLW